MYLTPIFWTTDFISQMAHWIQVLVVVNPMYNYLQFMRDIFLFNTVPSALTFGLCVVWAILASCYWLRRLSQDRAQVYPLHLRSAAHD